MLLTVPSKYGPSRALLADLSEELPVKQLMWLSKPQLTSV